MSLIGNIETDFRDFWRQCVGMIFTPQSSDPITGTGKARLWVKVSDKSLHYTDTDGDDAVIETTPPAEEIALLGTAQTFTGAKTFETATLLLRNAADTFSATFTFLGTAARAIAFPDIAGTLAVTGQTTSATAPSSLVNIATPAFSGTGMTAAGQAMTSTDNQTMTLNQCAGMWLVCATHGPYLIASNTAVSGAPAVLTIYGGAPTTDAGTYKIMAGVVASHTHTNG